MSASMNSFCDTTSGCSSRLCGLQSGVSVSMMLLCFFPLVPVSVIAPRSKLIQSGHHPVNLSAVGVKCRSREQVSLRHCRYPNNPGWLVSHRPVPFFTPPSRSCVEQLFTSRSGYTCGWASASLVKPKRWPGILSFDPCLKSALVARLHSHDCIFPSLSVVAVTEVVFIFSH